MTSYTETLRSASGFNWICMRAVIDGVSVAAAASGVSGYRVHRRILLDDLHHLQQIPFHGLKGGVLIGDDGPVQPPIVLLREKSLGHVNEEVHVEADGGGQNAQRDGGMPQHAVQRAPVQADDPIECRVRWCGTSSRAMSCSLSRCAHIMGVVVSEITMEIAMATDSVTANSRNKRPTMPPISSSGMNTAISDTLMVKTVDPISRAPRRAAANGFMPCSR